jgi:hypothetical protein
VKILIVAALLVGTTYANAQWRGEWVPTSTGYPSHLAGKIEPRIGAWRESANDKLRLDIGASVPLYEFSDADLADAYGDAYRPLVEVVDARRIILGADFFTWTRLRSSGGFKFPVESVDYYFGVFASGIRLAAELPAVRLRVAHISAHTVDGDSTFGTSSARYMTYSREFVDASFAWGTMGRVAERLSRRSFTYRPYVGAVFLFHTVPDTRRRITPYAGIEGAWSMSTTNRPTLTLAYELRLNTELAPIAEHSVTASIRTGRLDERGVSIDASYYAGRSHFGQHCAEHEEYWSIGFGVLF